MAERIKPELKSFTLMLAMAVVALQVMVPAATASTKSKSATLTTNQELTLVPKCPKGQRATGGGFLAPPSASMSPGPNAIFYESRKSGQRAWRVSVRQGLTGTLPVTVYVYCDADAPATKTKSATVAVPGGLGASAEASCGSAGKAQAGGYAFPPQSSGSAVNLYDSYRSTSKSWRTRGNAGLGAPTLTSFVYCADSGSPKARSGGASVSGDIPAVTVHSAPCKAGTHVGAGGFSQPTAVPGDSGFEGPYESRRSGKKWRQSMYHFGTITRLNSIAYCV